MNADPLLAPMNDREQQVRERAYYMWEAEGRPHGRAEIHWIMAEIATAVYWRRKAPPVCARKMNRGNQNNYGRDPAKLKAVAHSTTSTSTISRIGPSLACNQSISRRR